MKFDGTRDELERVVSNAGLTGVWTEEGDKICFRSKGGAVLSWWPHSSNMRVLVQGPSPYRGALEGELVKRRTTSIHPAKGLDQGKIFIVHGHDTIAREQLELVLHRLRLHPFILQNTSGSGMTIIEALEKDIVQSAPAFGIVLMTPDDIGYAASAGANSARPRARQNVVLELGMLIARIGRGRTAILTKGDTEIPSDASGVIYLHFKSDIREIIPTLVARLIEAGFALDVADIARASA